MWLSSRQRGAEEIMAIVSYNQAATVHATTRRLPAWGRLAALGLTVGCWATIIAAARAIL